MAAERGNNGHTSEIKAKEEMRSFTFPGEKCKIKLIVPVTCSSL